MGHPGAFHIQCQSSLSNYDFVSVQGPSFPPVAIQMSIERFAAGAMHEGTVEGFNGVFAVKQFDGTLLQAKAKLDKAGAPYLACP